MLEFAPEFFEEEVRDGFTVSPMMKVTWAAELELLARVDAICKEHDIQYFADWGTMLGAVRHHGFIPWDDDIDIGMTRENQKKFAEVMTSGMYEDLDYYDVYNAVEIAGRAARVSTKVAYITDREYIKKWHGFCFPVGMDIFTIDYIPRDPAEFKEQMSIIELIHGLGVYHKDMDAGVKFSKKELRAMKELCRVVEKRLNIKFSQELPSTYELYVLLDEVEGAYGPEDGDFLAHYHRLERGQLSYQMSKEGFSDVIRMPFENITIPVAVGYDEQLRLKYGDNYMTPVQQGCGHEYPFYNVFIRSISKDESPEGFEKMRKHIEEISAGYYLKHLHKSSEPRLSEADFPQATKEQLAILEVLDEVKSICKKNHLKLYDVDAYKGRDGLEASDSGFAQPTVGLLRLDYQDLLDLLPKELDPWFSYISQAVDTNYAMLASQVYADISCNDENEYLKRFHESEELASVRVVPIDAVAPAQENQKSKEEILTSMLQFAQGLPESGPYSDLVMETVKVWENTLHITLINEYNLKANIYQQIEKYNHMFEGEKHTKYTVTLEEDIAAGKWEYVTLDELEKYEL